MLINIINGVCKAKTPGYEVDYRGYDLLSSFPKKLPQEKFKETNVMLLAIVGGKFNGSNTRIVYV